MHHRREEIRPPSRELPHRGPERHPGSHSQPLSPRPPFDARGHAMKGVGKFGEVMADEKGPADFGASIDKLRRVVRSGSQPKAMLDFVVKELRRTFPHYSWVGIYLVEGDELVLRAW